MGHVKNGYRGTLQVAGLDDMQVGVQTPTDAEAAQSGALFVVAFPPPKGARQIKPGDAVVLDGVALRVISYGPSAITRPLMVMHLGAVGAQ